MLQLKTVEPYTLSILKQLMEMPVLQDFSLVGGTALSLLYGHRMSVDLDLFSNKLFENSDIVDALKSKITSFLIKLNQQINQQHENSFSAFTFFIAVPDCTKNNYCCK
jgi:hypothetical protein